MTDQLLEVFPESNLENWIQAAQAEVKKDLSVKKLGTVLDGVPIEAFYDISSRSTKLDYTLPASKDLFFGARKWLNAAPIEVNEEKEANNIALKLLESGADGILFNLKKDLIEIDVLLNGIDPSICSINFKSGVQSKLEGDFYKYIKGKYQPDKITGSFFRNKHENFSNELPNFRSLGIVSGEPSISNHIADLLVQVVELVDLHKHASPQIIFSSIAFSISSQSNFFLEIVRHRALRIVWSKLQVAYNQKPIDAFIHTETTYSDRDAYNPHSNMLFGTVSGIAAIIGGCDALSIHSEDPKDEMMTRIAKNLPIILREESNLHRVADPLAGSYFIDYLTYEVAKKSWKEFLTKVDS